MVKPADALKLSAWLAVHEPALFRQMLVLTKNLQRTPLGKLGYFGDDAGMAEVTVTADALPPPTFDFTVSDPTLTDITFDSSSLGLSSSVADAIAAPVSVDTSTADSSQSSGDFWSAIGGGVSNVAGAVAKVASGLLSPMTLSSAATATAAYFNAQARSAQTAAQQAATQTQFSRVAAGLSPAPITYVTNPLTGARTPVYSSNAGPVPLSAPVVSRLTQATLSTPTWLIAGGLALAIAVALLSAR